MLDLIIQGGLLVSPDQIVRADVAIKDGRIVAVGDASLFPPAQRIIDIEGKYLLPGLIDAHVHFNLPLGEFTTCDNWTDGTRAAAFGGVTCVVDFAIPGPGESPLTAFERRRAEAEGHAVIDFGLHACVTRANAVALAEIPRLIDSGAATIKIFTVYRDTVMVSYGEARAILEQLRGSGGMAAFHAEDAAIIEFEIERCVSTGATSPRYHAVSRPAAAEVVAMQALVELLRETGSAGYFVHMTSGAGERILRAARQSGISLYGETCPHYLILGEEVYDRPDGQNFICSPPIRPATDAETLWEMAANGAIQMVNADHCCYNTQQKAKYRNNFTQAPNGLPGVETRLPLLYSEGVGQGRITLGQLVSLTSTNVAKLMGLFPRKGIIRPGSDADLVVLDPNVERRMTASELHMATDYTPFEGIQVKGWPVLTIARGRVVVENGQFWGRPGQGRYIHRRIEPTILAGSNL